MRRWSAIYRSVSRLGPDRVIPLVEHRFHFRSGIAGNYSGLGLPGLPWGS